MRFLRAIGLFSECYKLAGSLGLMACAKNLCGALRLPDLDEKSSVISVGSDGTDWWNRASIGPIQLANLPTNLRKAIWSQAEQAADSLPQPDNKLCLRLLVMFVVQYEYKYCVILFYKEDFKVNGISSTRSASSFYYCVYESSNISSSEAEHLVGFKKLNKNMFSYISDYLSCYTNISSAGGATASYPTSGYDSVELLLLFFA